MMRSVTMALAGLALLVMAACATGPQYAYAPWNASISDPGEIYSTYKWGPEIDAGLASAGRAAEAETIKARATEAGWPAKLADFQQRLDHPEVIKTFKGEVVAIFMNGTTPVAVFHAPAAKNKQMPEGWQPAEDIYIFVKQIAVSRAK